MNEPSDPTSSAAASPARTSRSRAQARASTVRSPASGPSSRASFAFYDPTSSSWKTSQRSLVEDSTAFSETLPRSGSMRSGRLFSRQMSARPTVETDSSCWPTPTASEYGSSQNGINGVAALFPTPSARDAKGCGAENHPDHGGPTLPNFIRDHWATPTASCATDGNASRGGDRSGELLLTGQARAASLWPTPTAQDAASSGAAGYSTESGRHPGTTLTDATVRTGSRQVPPRSPDGMVLNPRFVEAMMGFPDGHTACA